MVNIGVIMGRSGLLPLLLIRFPRIIFHFNFGKTSQRNTPESYWTILGRRKETSVIILGGIWHLIGRELGEGSPLIFSELMDG